MNGFAFDWTISVGNVLTVVIVTGGAIAAWFELRGRSLNNAEAILRLERDMDIAVEQAKSCREATAKADSADKKSEILGVECRLLKEQLYEFREKVAGLYVTIPLMGEFRTEMNENFHQLSERLDRVFTRTGTRE